MSAEERQPTGESQMSDQRNPWLGNRPQCNWQNENGLRCQKVEEHMGEHVTIPKQPTMTTQEQMLAEAREHLTRNSLPKRAMVLGSGPDKDIDWAQEFSAFALSQLRAAKESGHLRHLEDCAKMFRAYHECSCGFAEKWGDLL